MTGFRAPCPRPEKTEENGRVGRTAVCTFGGGGRALLSRSRETTVELHSDSEYADSIFGGRKTGPSSSASREEITSADHSRRTHQIRQQWSRSERWSSRPARHLWS